MKTINQTAIFIDFNTPPRLFEWPRVWLRPHTLPTLKNRATIPLPPWELFLTHYWAFSIDIRFLIWMGKNKLSFYCLLTVYYSNTKVECSKSKQKLRWSLVLLYMFSHQQWWCSHTLDSWIGEGSALCQGCSVELGSCRYINQRWISVQLKSGPESVSMLNKNREIIQDRRDVARGS